MELEPYIATLRQEFALAAEAAGGEAMAVAERLIIPLESSVRLALLEALSAAADEITCDLAPGSVHVRLQGREPQFVVTPAPAESFAAAGPAPASAALPPAPEGDDGAIARINLRLAEHLKNPSEQAAERHGVPAPRASARPRSGARSRQRRPPARRRRRPALHRLGPLARRPSSGGTKRPPGDPIIPGPRGGDRSPAHLAIPPCPRSRHPSRSWRPSRSSSATCASWRETAPTRSSRSAPATRHTSPTSAPRSRPASR